MSRLFTRCGATPYCVMPSCEILQANKAVRKNFCVERTGVWDCKPAGLYRQTGTKRVSNVLLGPAMKILQKGQLITAFEIQ